MCSIANQNQPAMMPVCEGVLSLLKIVQRSPLGVYNIQDPEAAKAQDPANVFWHRSANQ
jgi:hypothetical protein